MKNFELNSLSRKVLVVLTWLLTFTCVTSITVSGTGFFGALTFYVLLLILVFGITKDEALQKEVVKSLIVSLAYMLIVAVFSVFLFPIIEQALNASLSGAETIDAVAKAQKAITNFGYFKNIMSVIFTTVKYVLFTLFCLMAVIKKEAKAVEPVKEEKTENSAE